MNAANLLEIEGYQATIQYDSEIEMFRGEFIGLTGGADFYATDIRGLRREGKASLVTYLKMCSEKGIEPRRQYSGKFNVRLPIELREAIATEAASKGKSLNQWVHDTPPTQGRDAPVPLTRTGINRWG